MMVSTSAHDSALPPLGFRTAPIPRVSAGVDGDAFERDWLRPHRPVVLENAISEWPASRRWDFERLVERFGDRLVPGYVFHGGRFAADATTGIVPTEVRLSSYVEQMLRGASAVDTVVCWRLGADTAELNEDVPMPGLIRNPVRPLRNVWISARGTVTHMHQDSPHNLLAQVRGRKLVVLFSPWESPKLYRHPLLGSLSKFSRVDVEHPDAVRFPRFPDARGLTTVLSPGDMLYIPPFWWHYVRALDPSISVNTWWWGRWAAPIAYAGAAYTRLRGLAL